MNTAKKMAIVPYKIWEDMIRWRQEQIQSPKLPPKPEVLETAKMQRNLSSVLADENLSEAEKALLHGEALHKFKTIYKKADREIVPSFLKDMMKEEREGHATKTIDRHILESVPKTMRRKAELLLSMLKEKSNLSWDEDGTVRFYGKPIPDSNIIDLVNDTLRQRKGMEPRGWEHFAEGLREVNIPQDIVGNRERWEWMHKTPAPPPVVSKRKKKIQRLEDEDEVREEFATPLLPTVKKRTPSRRSSRRTKRKSIKKELDYTPEEWINYE